MPTNRTTPVDNPDPGKVKALSTRGALRVATRARRDLDAAVQAAMVPAVEDSALGFLGRDFVMATLPHKRVSGDTFVRKNGAFTLTMKALGDYGLPYGTIPRLLLIWISEEVVRKKERKLVLGDSLTAFMAELGMVPTGGRWGSITRLKRQVLALMDSAISVNWDTDDVSRSRRMLVSDESELWWDRENPGQRGLFDSYIVLGERLFEELRDHSVPFDKRVLRRLTKSPLSLDIYVWLSYRMHSLSSPQEIKWDLLKGQFGSDYANTNAGVAHFKAEFKKQLKRVLKFYRAKVEPTDAALILKPSPTSIPKALR